MEEGLPLNHFEVLSTYETLTRRMRGHKILLWNLVKIWRKDYLLNLREFHSVKKRGTTDRSIAIEDIVILKDDLTKRMFWKMGIVEKLLPGRDGLVRAAMVRVSSTDGCPTLLRRSVKHLIPLEVSKELN